MVVGFERRSSQDGKNWMEMAGDSARGVPLESPMSSSGVRQADGDDDDDDGICSQYLFFLLLTNNSPAGSSILQAGFIDQ